MLRFNKRVRISLAAQFIKLSWAGSAVFGFLGWVGGSGIVIAGITVWWLVLQGLAHVILAYDNDSDNDSDDSS